jgi:hypothetical protein
MAVIREDRVRMRRVALGVIVLVALTGCGKRRDSAARPMTEAQRDSVIARSSLPGASVVGRALSVSGKARDHAAVIDSLTR